VNVRVVRATLHQLHTLLRDEWVEFTLKVVAHCTTQLRGSVQDLSRNLPRSE